MASNPAFSLLNSDSAHDIFAHDISESSTHDISARNLFLGCCCIKLASFPGLPLRRGRPGNEASIKPRQDQDKTRQAEYSMGGYVFYEYALVVLEIVIANSGITLEGKMIFQIQ